MLNRSKTTLVLRVLPAMLAAVFTHASAADGGEAQATSAVSAKQTSDADTGKVEEVVVTATKRAVPLQSVPVAITVLSGAQLQKSNLNNISTIVSLTPTATFRPGASNKDTSLFIRGVGTISTSPGIEPTVSTVVDGVVLARPGQATLDLLELDRVEVLRGPQGTLFGKNASAGVMNIVTRDPGKVHESYLDGSWYQGGEKRVRAGTSGELSKDAARGSIALMHADYDGNVTNVFDGSKVNGYRRDGMRGKLVLTPRTDLRIGLIADYSDARDTTPTGVPSRLALTAYPTYVTGAPNLAYAAAVAPVVASDTNRQINSEMLTRVDDTNWGLSGQVDWALPGKSTLTSITAYRKWENTQYQDQDRLPKPYKQFNQTADQGDLAFDQWTQELRIASPLGQFFDYVGGLFYMKAKNAERYQRDVTRCAASTAAAGAAGLVPCTAATTTVDTGVANYGIDSKSTSLFGEGTFNLTSRFRALVGARVTRDDLSFRHLRTSTAAADIPGVRKAFSADGSTSESGRSGRLGAQLDVAKDVMSYLTYSRGYKGPAYNVFFNMQAFDTIAIKPETSKAWELGAKSTLLNNTLLLNAAVFNTKYENYQANTNDVVAGAIVNRLINAGAVSTKGVELDFQARITRQFTLSGAAAHMRARIDSFNCPPGASINCNVNGQPLPFAPDSRYNLRAQYKMPMGEDWTLDLATDYAWQSETQYDIGQAPDARQPAYGILNGQVSLYNSDSGWSVTFVGRNLANKSYSSNLVAGGGIFLRYVPRDAQRYFGVNIRKDF